MFKRLIGIAALALSCTAQAQPQPQPTVVDLPTRPGVTQRMLVITPPEPKAAVVLLAGGHGGLQIFPNGSFKWGEGNFLVRSRQLFGDKGLMTVVVDYTRWFLARLRAVEAAVAQSEYLCAGRFTAADVAVGYALLLAQHLGLAPQFGTATQAYWQRLQARPGYQRAMAAQLRAAVEQGVPTTPAPDTQP